jgi:hypothetical protein
MIEKNIMIPFEFEEFTLINKGWNELFNINTWYNLQAALEEIEL